MEALFGWAIGEDRPRVGRGDLLFLTHLFVLHTFPIFLVPLSLPLLILLVLILLPLHLHLLPLFLRQALLCDSPLLSLFSMSTDERLLSFLNHEVSDARGAGPACKCLREYKLISCPQGFRIIIFFTGTNALALVFKRALPRPAPVAAEGVGESEVVFGGNLSLQIVRHEGGKERRGLGMAAGMAFGPPFGQPGPVGGHPLTPTPPLVSLAMGRL